MTTYTIGIVAHTERVRMARWLSNKVKAKVLSVDDGTLGPGKNHLWVWKHLGTHYADAEWSVVLEDDAIPCEEFDGQLCAALAKAPAPVVSLYLGRTRPGYWQPSIARAFGQLSPAVNDDPPDPCYFTGLPLLHCVGVAIKTSLVPVMVDCVKHRVPSTPIDEAIAGWAGSRHIEVAYTRPSLVNHDDGIPTVIAADQRTTAFYHDDDGRREGLGYRVAWDFGTRTRWNGSAMHVNHVPVPREAMHLG